MTPCSALLEGGVEKTRRVLVCFYQEVGKLRTQQLFVSITNSDWQQMDTLAAQVTGERYECAPHPSSPPKLLRLVLGQQGTVRAILPSAYRAESGHGLWRFLAS